MWQRVRSLSLDTILFKSQDICTAQLLRYLSNALAKVVNLGTPSEQAEWGHPDVAILFTTLSFYLGGVNLEQLRNTLGHVLKSDDPAQVYDGFSAESSLPGALRLWNAINVDDEGQLKEIWTHLRTSMIVSDYYLNNFGKIFLSILEHSASEFSKIELN
jgi:hypothetical protein